MRLRLSVLLLAVACALMVAASASASSGATVTPFAGTYPGGIATCTGNRITHTTGGTTFIKDVETCIVLADFSEGPGTYDVNSPVVGGWCSDFDSFLTGDFTNCNLAVSGHLTVTDNGDGTVTWDIVAYYAQP
jgi:hypothetical protein